jgi:hypothetical protein
MEKTEKKQTNSEENTENILISDALIAFNILLKIGINDGIDISELSIKSNIPKQSLHRYSSAFESQKISQPSVVTLNKLAVALGYEIRLIKK